MKSNLLLSFATCVAAATLQSAQGGINLLSNPGFEEGSTGWSWQPSGYAFPYDPSNLGISLTAQEGSKTAELYHSHDTSVQSINTSQLITTGIAPNQYITLTGFALNRELDPESYAQVRIEYFGGSPGTFVMRPEIQSSQLTWVPFSLTTTTPTPEDVTGVRITAELISSANPDGAVFYDNLSAVSEVPELPVTGIAGAVFALGAAVVHRLRSKAATR